MKREEAIKVVRNIYQTDAEKEALETLIPELKESEDERIIKTLQEYVKNRNWNLGGPTQDEVLAWLEKQEQKFKFKQISDGVIWDSGLRTGIELGKKEQEPVLSKDEKVRRWILEYFYLHRYELRGASVSDMDILDWLERHKEPTAKINGEPISTENQTVNVGDDETEVQKAYREGKNAGRKEVFDHPEYYGLQLRRMYDYETGERKPEWSDEDEKMLYQVLCYLDPTITRAKREELESWLKSLLERFGLQPKPAWSEEDKEWLSEVYFAIDHSMYSDYEKRSMKKYIDNLRKDRNTCDVDEFSLTLRNCLSTDSELTKMQADLFARAYGEDLYKVALGEMKTGLDRYDIEEYRNETKFDPKPGEKFWVRCKTNKTVNLWFDKDDERPAYAVTDPSGIITYIVHIKKDGTGNCVSYQNKEKFLETFDILESKR